MTLQNVAGLLAALLLSGCSPSDTSATPTRPSTTPTTIAALPTEEPAAKPVPLAAARIVESFGDQVLASQNGNFQVHLKPAGTNLDIALVKTRSVDDPAFSTGATSGPRDFEGRILQDLETHPEFRLPLVTVLEAAQRPENIEALALSPEHQAAAKSLLEAVRRETQ